MKKAQHHGFLSLKNYQRNKILKFREDIRECLIERNLFALQTMEEIYYEFLRSILETKNVRRDSKSIKKELNKVLKYFAISEPLKISIQKLGEKVEPKKTFVDQPMERFHYLILGFDLPPYYELEKLRPRVERDLREINKLIKYYESTQTISNLLTGKNEESYHEDMTIIHFYRRCLKERQNILDYFLDGMYKQALSKAQSKKSLSGVFEFMESYYDYPYDFNSYLRLNYDHRDINSSIHRIGHVYLDEISVYEKLYKLDKEKFYRKLFKLRSVSTVFEGIDFYLSHLPLNNERKLIFQELEKLFKSKKWLAFYAIALPQVEGLFAEMVQAFSEKPTKKALSAKVRLVRKENNDDKYLDYYEYVLPKQRNIFAHGGLVGDIKLSAFDLLTDLEYVLGLFSSLENPFVKLTRMILQKNPVDFISYEGLSDYFDCFNNLLPSQKRQMKDEITTFESEFLMKELPIKKIADQAYSKLIEYSVSIQEKADRNFKDYDFNSKDATISPLHDREIYDIKEYFMVFADEEITNIFAINSFFGGLKRIMGSKDFLESYSQEWELIRSKKNLIANIKNILKT